MKTMLTIEEILTKGGPSPLQALDYLYQEAREHEGAYKDFRVRTKMRHACRRALLQAIIQAKGKTQ